MIGDDQHTAWITLAKRVALSSLSDSLAKLVGTAERKYLAATGAEPKIDADVDEDLIANGFGPSELARLQVADQANLIALHRWRALGPVLAKATPTSFLLMLRALRDLCAILDKSPEPGADVAAIVAAATARLAKAKRGPKRKGRPRLDDDSPIAWRSKIEALTAASALSEAKGSGELVGWGHVVAVRA